MEENIEKYKIFKKISDSTLPSDVFEISNTEINKLSNILKIKQDINITDIFISKMISLLDIKIQREDILLDDLLIGLTSFRIKIFENYSELINSKSSELINIGILIFDVDSDRELCSNYLLMQQYIIPIYYNKKDNQILLKGPVIVKQLDLTYKNEEYKTNIIKDLSTFSDLFIKTNIYYCSNNLTEFINYKLNEMKFNVIEPLYNLLNIWYIIQISLLHPQIKEIYNSPARKEFKSNNNTNKKPNKKKSNKIKYYKHHFINSQKIDNVLNKYKSKQQRHTLVWYVAGHFRKYKSGKEIYIQPQWRGPLRGSKIVLESREREIPTE